ncbi:MAG: arginine--tRNA ligase, partial [Candidatus Thermoplasmatota archaeon]|nr:arginine--tRNA ligase [Candidatus Thermoplasmatota archaeon]
MAQLDPRSAFRQEALALAAEALHAVYGIADPIDDLLEEPDPELADFALPCFAFAGELSKSPVEIAASLPEALPPVHDFTIEAKGPYLNFKIEPRALAREVLEAIQARGETYGHLEETGRTVLVEHTSANPTGPLHVGRARNPLLSDTLVRVLRAAGYTV